MFLPGSCCKLDTIAMYGGPANGYTVALPTVLVTDHPARPGDWRSFASGGPDQAVRADGGENARHNRLADKILRQIL